MKTNKSYEKKLFRTFFASPSEFHRFSFLYFVIDLDRTRPLRYTSAVLTDQELRLKPPFPVIYMYIYFLLNNRHFVFFFASSTTKYKLPQFLLRSFYFFLLFSFSSSSITTTFPSFNFNIAGTVL